MAKTSRWKGVRAHLNRFCRPKASWLQVNMEKGESCKNDKAWSELKKNQILSLQENKNDYLQSCLLAHADALASTVTFFRHRHQGFHFYVQTTKVSQKDSIFLSNSQNTEFHQV